MGHDWEIFFELQKSIEHDGVLGNLLGSAKRKVIKRFFGPERILDLGLRFGPYGGKLNPLSKGLTLRKLKAAVHGIDLGPLSSCLPGRLRTADRRIELAPRVLVNDIERVKAKLLEWNGSLGHGDQQSATPLAHDFVADSAGQTIQSSPASSISLPSPGSNGHLLLIGRRQLRSNNSWMHNSERLVKGKSSCTILMSPTDAVERRLSSGQTVSVRSKVGSIELPIEISDEMMPGVVSIPHGWGHGRLGVRLDVAEQHAGSSINDLTDNQTIDALCGTAAFNGTMVEVAAI
jgi:anaerobic selenocysteine-containing dehydrogenase